MRLLKQLSKIRAIYCKIKYQCTEYQYISSRQLCSTAHYDLNLVINGVNVNKYVNKLEQEYTLLKQSANNKGRMLDIEPIIYVLQERRKLIRDIKNLDELLDDKDKEMKEMADEEKKHFINQINGLNNELEEALLNIDNSDNYDGIVLEINAGVGGQEAMLFAKELFDMYCGFIEYKGWSQEVAEYLKTDIGGIRHASVLVNGNGVFKYFQHEAGVHRVQRIPATEKAGRVHTSTASVLALPQPTEIDINIETKDLRIETKRASGAGGQHVNTTDSAVRITHLLSGISIECQVDRSQVKNRAIAMQRLRAKLYDLELQKQQDKQLKTKMSQVKSNYRNEKIRTYNFSQDRITDHRLQNANIHNLKHFMEGNELLENLIDKLDYKTRVDRFLEIVKEINK